MRHLILLTLISIAPFVSWAQTDLVAKKEIPLDEKAQEGWTPKLKLSTNVSLQSSKQVVGQTDGDTYTIGGKIESAMNHKKDTKEWRNSLDYAGATTRTASLPRYVKSSDSLKFETTYLYGLESMPKLGPYVKGSAETAVFKGEDVRAKTVTYSGTGINSVTADSYRLTDGFKPLTTKEAVGFFYKFIDRKNTKLEARMGLGGVQVSADGQLYVKKADDTTVTLDTLESYSQSGLEYGLVWTGQWNETSSYSLTADFLTPFGTDIKAGKPCDDCKDLELTNVDIKASASTKVSDWATLAYEYKALKQPQLFNKFQIQHGLVLNIVYDVFK